MSTCSCHRQQWVYKIITTQVGHNSIQYEVWKKASGGWRLVAIQWSEEGAMTALRREVCNSGRGPILEERGYDEYGRSMGVIGDRP